MNRQNFEAKDRFPLSTQALAFMQDMILASANLARIGGDNYILSGCETTGNSVAPGVIVINGEVMPFEGGTAVPTITIVEQAERISANGLTFEQARITRKAKFATGTGANYYPWANFSRLQTNKQLEEAKATMKYVDDEIAKIQAGSIPSGIITMWSGSEASIPAGWVLCDGREATPGKFVPNLSGRFIVGFNREDEDYNQIGNTGGVGKVSLTIDEMPRHNHLTTSKDKDSAVDEGMYGLVRRSKTTDGKVTPYSSDNPGKGTEPDITVSPISVPYQGSGAAHENRPPYYVLAFIIKL